MKYLSLDEIHFAEAEMLRWLYAICKEKGIPLCLGGGTLIGAIRHKGFIPWDDDIDLMIPRSSYDELIDILEKTVDDKYEVVSMRDGKSMFSYAKIIEKTVFLDKSSREVTSNLWIDIFPVDGLPEDPKKMHSAFKKAKLYRMWLSVSMSNDLNAGSRLKRLLKPIVIIPAKIIGARKWLLKLDRLCRKIGFGNTKYVGVLCGGYGKRECMPYADWVNYSEAEFEGDKYAIPGCWDYYLTSLYGNYMELPPEDKRKTHSVIAYRK